MNYVVVDKEKLESDLTIVADSIRAKSGTTEDLAFPSEFKSVVESIDTSKEEQEKTIDITENGTTEVTPDEGKVLSKVTVNTNVESGGGSSDKFVEYVQGTLTEINNNEVTKVKSYVFYGCLFIEYVNLPLVEELESYAFQNCSNIKEINLQSATLCGNQCFQNCNRVTKFNVPNLTRVAYNTFNGCKSNRILDLPKCNYIDANGFVENLSLIALVLRNNAVTTLKNINAFNLCPHYKGTVDSTYNPDGLFDGYVYVPRDLITSYQTATNWSTLYASHPNVFRALEDYTVDGTITGELDESKI